MKRGEIWTLQDTGYASKARPVVIVQNDAIDEFDSLVLCLLTTYASDDIPVRVRIEPDEANGLEKTSYVMTDKIVTVDRNMLGFKIGALDAVTMDSVTQQLAVMLGIE